jgi:hypothetical protein
MHDARGNVVVRYRAPQTAFRFVRVSSLPNKCPCSPSPALLMDFWGSVQCNGAAVCLRPNEPPTFQSLREQAKTACA